MILVDLAGKEVFRMHWTKGQYSTQIQLDFTGVQTGIYFLKAIKGASQSTQKLIISN